MRLLQARPGFPAAKFNSSSCSDSTGHQLFKQDERRRAQPLVNQPDLKIQLGNVLLQIIVKFLQRVLKRVKMSFFMHKLASPNSVI